MTSALLAVVAALSTVAAASQPSELSPSSICRTTPTL